MSDSYYPGPVCSSQKDKSFWISTFSSFGSSFLLLSILSLMIYFSLWRNKTSSHAFTKNFSHLSFVISLFLKAVGFCAAGILLRFQINWQYISPFILDIPQASITFGFSFIFMVTCISYGHLLSKQAADKFNKAVYGISILSGIFLLCTVILCISYYLSEKSIIFHINLWVSSIRDMIISISYIILFSLIQKLRVVPPNDANQSEKNVNILSYITLSCLILRAILYPIEIIIFSPKLTHNQTSQCGIGALLYFVFQTIFCDILPVICVLLLQGMMDTVLSYDSIQ